MAGTLKYVCMLLYRLLLPLVLLGATIFRFNFLSLVYGLLLLVAPLLPSPSASSMTSHTARYLRSLISVSLFFIVGHAAFQGALLLMKPIEGIEYYNLFPDCSVNESIARQFGFQRLNSGPDDAVNVVRLILPDVVVFFTAIILYLVCRKLVVPSTQQSLEDVSPGSPVIGNKKSIINTFRIHDIIEDCGQFFVFVTLGLSGIMSPSVLSSVYFLTFLIIATWWSCYKAFGTFGIIYFKVSLLLYSAAHLVLLYVYQFEFFQQELPPDDFYARLFGLTGLIKTNCSLPMQIHFHQNEFLNWTEFASPGVILVFYYCAALQFQHWMSIPKADREAHIVRTVQGQPKNKRKKKMDERQPISSTTQTSLIDDTVHNPTYSSIDRADDTDQDVTSGDEGGPEPRKVQDYQLGRRKSIGERSTIKSVLMFIINQSYLVTLIFMMAWSIVYHSWLSFVLLFAACLIWITPNARKICLVCSPVIVFYAEALVIIQYVYGLKLTDDELVETEILKEVGLQKTDVAFVPLLVKMMLFTGMFWLTLYQLMRSHNQYQQTHQPETEPSSSTVLVRRGSRRLTYDHGEGYDSEEVRVAGRILQKFLRKYWIFVCAALFLFMAVQEAVVYRLIYMVLFLFFVQVFQISFRAWRFLLYGFWWFVIVYSMIVLILIYTYQFETFQNYWNSTNLNETTLKDIGLEKYDSQQLAQKLLTPTIFLIFIIVQVHIFHKPFLKISDINRYKNERRSDLFPASSDDETETAITDVVQKSSKFFSKATWTKILCLYNEMCELIWRTLEVHIFKLVVFTIIIVSLVNVSAISGIFVVLVGIMLPVPRLHGIVSILCHFWAGLVILMKMTFQLNSVEMESWFVTCNFTKAGNGSTENITEVNNAPWTGLQKLTNQSLGDYVVGYIFIVLILGLEAIVKVRQTQHFNHTDVVRPRTGIIFPEVRRENADAGFLAFLQYLFNYAFYKFGVEICFTMTVIVISVRLDAYSILYALLLGVGMLCARQGRNCLAIWWPVYVILLAVFLPVQYVLCLGAPPGFCWIYPWMPPEFPEDLQLWMYLPQQEGSLNSMKLLADFFQFLFACLLWNVFRLEKSPNVDSYGGGDNSPIAPKHMADHSEIPVADYITEKKTFLDVLKAGVFQYMFWVTFSIVFLTGTSKISLFCFGYLLACFYLFWCGEDLLVKSQRKLLRVWSIVQGYNFFVIFTKCCLQVVACVYIKEFANVGGSKGEEGNKSCTVGWVLIQLLNLVCLNSETNSDTPPDNPSCSFPLKDQAGLGWDCVCFVFLLLQRRLFMTHYFRHVVLELGAQNKLASRGAELINRIMIRQVAEKKKREQEELQKIKKKMERIKLRQARLNQRAVVEYGSHYKTIRSGGEFMFEEDSDEEETISTVDRIDSHIDSTESSDKPLGPMQLLNAALEGGTKKALQQQKARASTIITTPQDTQPTITPTTPTTNQFGGDSASVDSITPIPHDSHTDGEVSDIGHDDIASGKMKRAELHDVELIESDPEAEETETKKAGCCEKCLDIFRLLWALLSSVIDSCTKLMNSTSKDYRLVARILDTEKKEVKNQLKLQLDTNPEDNGSFSLVETPDPNTRTEMEHVRIDIPNDTPEHNDKPRSLPLKSVSSLEVMADMTNDDPDLEKSRAYRFFKALYYALVSHTELLCFFVMILNQMVYASLLSLPLAIMVFFWGMLSVPRPAKAFWVTVITYTEIVVIVKYFFQFVFWDTVYAQNDETIRLIGLKRSSYYAHFDLVVLILVFLHRSLLKRHGLWKDANEIEEDMNKANRMESRPSSPLQLTATKELSLDDLDTSLPLGATAYDESKVDDGMQIDEAPSTSREEFVEEEDPMKTPSRKKRVRGWTAPFKAFYKQLTREDYNTTTDAYAYMFACDFISFFIVVFGYWGFGPAEDQFGDVKRYLSENRVPVLFLIMLITQFVLIIIDRALYLKKNITGKFIFHIVLIIGVHIWVFFVLPLITNREFQDDWPVIMWYFTKCVYLGLSATQIRCGYPTRVLGNFLTNNYNYLNLILFKGFLVIPFLLELRSLMDWIWTDTTLALSSWLQMEDIYNNVYVLKCYRWAEEKYPTPRGQPRKALIKYGFGGLVLFLVIFIIWFPLVLFSFANAVYVPNIPVECRVDISVAGYQPLFTMVTMDQDIIKYNGTMYDNISNQIVEGSKNRAASFLGNYEAKDTVLIKINGNSTAVWGISPPAEEQLKGDLASDKNMRFQIDLSFTRSPKSGLAQTTTRNKFYRDIEKNTKATFLKMLDRVDVNASMEIDGLVPQFIRLPVSDLPENVSALNTKIKNSMSLMLRGDNATQTDWWEIRADKSSPYIYITAFSERIAPSSLTLLTGYGIIGLYASFIFVVSRMLRVSFTGISQNIMFKELPYPDRIYNLCREIYLAREFRQHRLEEELFAKLLFIYRSPPTLIYMSRLKQEIIGLYVSLVFVVSRFVRSMTMGQHADVMFEELPRVDNIFSLCRKILLVRENREFKLEEDLYAKLLYLYRSPEMMIRWTRLKED